MARIDSLASRLRDLETAQGYEILSDGTRYRFVHSGIELLRDMIRTARDTGREAILSDFSEANQRDLLAYSRWEPDPAQHGQISLLTVKMAREIVNRSGEHEI